MAQPAWLGLAHFKRPHAHTLKLLLGSILLGMASAQARMAAGQASASATIVAEDPPLLPTLDLQSVAATVVTFDGVYAIQVGTSRTGSALIHLSALNQIATGQSAIRLSSSANKLGEPGSIGEISTGQIAQNIQGSDGALSGDLVVTVSSPPPSSGSNASNDTPSPRITVEFN